MDKFVNCVSSERFSTFLRASGFDAERAQALYFWDMDIASAFLPLIAQNEVCLRNKVIGRFLSVFEENWWENTEFHLLLGTKGKGIVLRARSQLLTSGKPVTHGRMAAAVSFGFWANMMLPKYEAVLWQDVHGTFPNLPSEVSCNQIYKRVRSLQELRNRITHHEPVLGRDLSLDYSNGLKLLEWTAPELLDWLRPKLRVAKLLRDKP